MTKILIDFEFNGLDHLEILEVKIMNIDTLQTYVYTFNYKYPMAAGAVIKLQKIYPQTGDKFSKKLFQRICNSLNINQKNCTFYGFSVSKDIEALNMYGIDIDIVDIKELMQLKKKRYENRMASEGNSLEACYYILTGQIATPAHAGVEELDLLYKIYQMVVPGRHHTYLSIVPFGIWKGAPLREYVVEHRRAADGYRRNNDDIYSKSLNYYCRLADNWTI